MVEHVPFAAKVATGILLILLALYMLVPLVVVIGTSFSESRFLSFPPDGFSLQWYEVAITSGYYLEPFQTSVAIAVMVAFVTAVLGTAAALAVGRFDFPGRGAVNNFLMSPLIVPSIILGIGALSFLATYANGPSFWALMAAHVVLSIPYVMRTVGGVMARSDLFIEEAARTLGANTWNRYRLVVLPAARPGIVAGSFFAFNLSFDDAVVALFLRTPDVETLPIAIYGRLEFSLDPSVAAVSTLMILITVITMVALERAIGLGRAFL
jgi:putative spermidine/putrescine transport system permease protein